jgi:multisubunit Na+/H+ antiporter MnhB subunit
MERLKTPEDLRLERITKKVKSIKGFYKHLTAYILVNLFLLALKYFQIENGERFLELSTFTTAFFWGIGLAFHAANVFGKNVFLGDDWEEKKIKEFMDKNQNTKWE